MSEYLKTYGETLGPVGVPMSDQQAFELEALLKTLPEADRRLRKSSNLAAMLTLDDNERADISWITTEAIDRDKEIVRAAGMNDSHFKLNPLVTLGHCYYAPPVGRSLWRKSASEDGRHGVLAKTHYPAKPGSWQDSWTPDEILALVQAGLMNGKSVGFIATKRHSPSEDEVKAAPALANVRSVIDEWLLLEYACCPIPCNPNTVTLNVSKSVRQAMGWPDVTLPTTPTVNLDTIPFITEAEVRRAFEQHIAGIDLRPTINAAAEAALTKHQGRV